MATYVKGDAVPNATSYELAEKSSVGEYTKLAENSEINFNVSALGLSVGDHALVVKAKATGYEDSDYSNEVKYTQEQATTAEKYDIEVGSLGSDSGNEVAYDYVWRTVDFIPLAELGTTLSVTGCEWIVAVYNASQKYLGQLAKDFGSLIKNEGQWLASDTNVRISAITAADSNAAYVRLLFKANSPKILIDGIDRFGSLV